MQLFYIVQSDISTKWRKTLQWRHNERESVSNHQPHDCLLNPSFRRRSKKTSKLRVTGLCMGNSPGTGEFPAQMASYAENVSIWWRDVVSSCCSHLVVKLHFSLSWRQNKHDGVSNNRRLDCLLSCLFKRRSVKTSKLRVTGLCEGNSPMTSEMSA